MFTSELLPSTGRRARLHLPFRFFTAARILTLAGVFLIPFLPGGPAEATPIALTDNSVFESGDYLIDFERVNTDIDGTIFNGSTEDIRDRQWVQTEYYGDYRVTFGSSLSPSTSTYKPNQLGTYRGATATDYPRDVFYSWADMGFFGPGTTTYDPSAGNWGYGALANFNNQTTDGGWIDILFDNAVERVGFNFITGSTALQIQVNGETLMYSSTMPWDLNRFAGVLDLGGIKHIRVSAVGGGAFLIDNLQFEGVPIPEPTSMTLLASGVALGIAARRRKAAANTPPAPTPPAV